MPKFVRMDVGNLAKRQNGTEISIQIESSAEKSEKREVFSVGAWCQKFLVYKTPGQQRI